MSYRKSSMERKSKRNSNTSLNEKQFYIQNWGRPITQNSNQKKISLIETNKDKILDILPGENHSFILKSNSLFAFGDNSYNQIYNDNKKDYSIPKIIRYKFIVKNIYIGCDFTFILDEKKKIYSFGLNIKGQLGLDHENNVNIPTLINSISSSNNKSSTKNFNCLLNSDEYINEISCGSLHTLVRSNHGRIFSTGFGETYALGHGNNSNLNGFKEITYFTEKYGKKKFKIDKIEAGVSHSGVIISKTLFIWGLYGHPKNSKIAKKPAKISLKSECKDVCMGDFLTVILTSKGNVFTIGENVDGQLGAGEKTLYSLANPVRVKFDYFIDFISTGLNHTFAISVSKNKIFAFGSNKENQIDPNSHKESFYFPEKIDFIDNVVSLKCKGNNTYCVTRNKIRNQRPKSEKKENNLEMTTRFNDIKKNLDSLARKNKLLVNENSKLKSEIKNLNLKVNESTQSQEKEINKSNYNTNDEINDVIKQFKRQLKKDKTLKPYFEIDFKEIEIINHIAEGGFGVIYKAKWRETIVAVKVLKPELMKEETIKDFLCKIKR